MLLEHFLVFERVMPLRIRHGTGIEPDIDQVRLPEHFLSGWAHQYDLIHVGTVQVEIFSQWSVHKTCFHSFIHFFPQFGEGTDAFFFFTIFR